MVLYLKAFKFWEEHTHTTQIKQNTASCKYLDITSGVQRTAPRDIFVLLDNKALHYKSNFRETRYKGD